MSFSDSEKERAKAVRFVGALISCYDTKADYVRLLDETSSLLSFFRSYPEFGSFLSSPLFPQEQKEKFLKELIRLFAFKQSYLSSTLLLLVQFYLIKYLTTFLESLIFKLELQLNQKSVKVFSSQKLTKTKQNKLEKGLRQKFGKEISIEYLISSEMIAGIKVEYDDTILECSLSKKLADIREKLSALA